MTAEAVIADAVERFHPRVALACSFQKEETVLLDLLFKARPGARVFALDTRVLFDETYEYWRRSRSATARASRCSPPRTRRTGCGRAIPPGAARSAR